MEKIRATVARWLGLDKQSKYVREYFYMTNMKASIYMSVVVIVLELWMIKRMADTIIKSKFEGDALWHVIEKYISNYFILLAAGILMLLYAVKAITDTRWVRWIAFAVIGLSAAVIIFEIKMFRDYTPETKTGYDLQNYLILFFAGILLILFSCLLIYNKRDKKWQSLAVMYIFSFICINFGIIISVNGYAKGEQMLTFLTMELFVICLLVWRPWLGFLVLTASYLVFYYRISGMIDPTAAGGFKGVVDFSQIKPGLGDGIKINGFTMWLSTLMFCVANYNKTRSQAFKDEHLEEVNAHLSEISITDDLTGIHNMLFFRSEAQRLLNYVTTDKENAVFLFMDIENFKSYNEKYGFAEGNEVLIKTAQIITEMFSGSLVSRYSDDHFVVLTRLEGCRELVGKVSNKIHELQREVHLELKCGAYCPSEEDETDASLACDRARFACNIIKKRYHQTFQMYDKELENKFRLKQYIVNNIDNAIENDYIKVFYQPVVNTADQRICGLEALARWQDPTYGLLPPGMFIDILEEYRQIHKLDQRITEIVCRDYREAADSGKEFVPVSLNFSRLDFELYDVPAFLDKVTEEYKVPKNYIDVEITESALTDQYGFLQKTVEQLRQSGYNVWLDDFGSGYSSLNVLKDYQFDVLKIDMKFLSGFGSNDKAAPILNNIVDLTKQLSMVSLTEGVETREQFEFLHSIGCDRVQGYLFSKPVPKDELYGKIAAGELNFEKTGTAANA